MGATIISNVSLLFLRLPPRFLVVSAFFPCQCSITHHTHSHHSSDHQNTMRLITIGLSAAALLVISKVQAQDPAPASGPIKVVAVDSVGDQLISSESLKTMDASIFPSAGEIESRVNIVNAFAVQADAPAVTEQPSSKDDKDKKGGDSGKKNGNVDTMSGKETNPSSGQPSRGKDGSSHNKSHSHAHSTHSTCSTDIPITPNWNMAIIRRVSLLPRLGTPIFCTRSKGRRKTL